eukprot:5031673-Amphidinium_carterae.2
MSHDSVTVQTNARSGEIKCCSAAQKNQPHFGFMQVWDRHLYILQNINVMRLLSFLSFPSLSFRCEFSRESVRCFADNVLFSYVGYWCNAAMEDPDYSLKLFLKDLDCFPELHLYLLDCNEDAAI